MARHHVLRMSRMFHRTLRDDPADAEVPSHRLLLRAGFIRRVAPGVYSWLPLGWQVVRRVEAVIRDEMERIGAQEVHLPALLPREPFERTGRWVDYGDSLFRLQDRRGADYLLGPTHEELFALTVGDICTSYKELPLTIYQIQTKFRDEARPRAGLLRGREFIMKDSYSFDLDDGGLRHSYELHREAYIRIFERLGLPYVIVAATAGAMGGSASEEFLAPIDVGEDSFAQCTHCGYAANVEAVSTAVGPIAQIEHPPAVEVDTPGTATIESVVDHLNAHPDLARPDHPWTAADTLKNLLVMIAHPDGSTEPLAIGLPGDRDLDLRRLDAHLEPATAQVFDADHFAAHPHLVTGYIGPRALGKERGIRYLLDPRVADGTVWVTGADREGRHVVGLVAGRDFSGDGFIDVAEVRAGDQCPQCGMGLALERGIEIGHIFQLGRRYTDALGVQLLGPEGSLLTPTMGSYGIGVSRAVAAVAEATGDDAGLCWPAEIAPADVHVVAAGRSDEVIDAAFELCTSLADSGVRVIHDDRIDASVGVKLTDAELIGVPVIVVIGKRLADGLVEVRDRRSGGVEVIPMIDAAHHLIELTTKAPLAR